MPFDEILTNAFLEVVVKSSSYVFMLRFFEFRPMSGKFYRTFRYWNYVIQHAIFSLGLEIIRKICYYLYLARL